MKQMKAKYFLCLLLLLPVFLFSQNKLIGLKYTANIVKNSCKENSDGGGCIFSTFMELQFNKDSVATIYYRRKSNDNYKGKYEVETKTHKYKVKNKIITIDGFYYSKLQFVEKVLTVVESKYKLDNIVVFYKND
jgi:hypothetical protein